MVNLVIPLLLAAHLTAEAGSQVSVATGTARPTSDGPVFGAPLRLRFLLDSNRGARGELGFAVRWDAADIPGLPRQAARRVLDPFGTMARAIHETIDGANLGLYAFHFKAKGVLPLDALLSPLSAASNWLRPPARYIPGALEAPAAAVSPVPRDRRHRLHLAPVSEELERGFRRDLHRAIIAAGFDLALPSRRSVPYAQKEAVLDSLRAAGDIWEEDLREIR